MTNNGTIGAKMLVILVDSKLTWKYTQYVVDKLCIAKGILSKLKHYAPIAVLRKVYYSVM